MSVNVSSSRLHTDLFDYRPPQPASPTSPVSSPQHIRSLSSLTSSVCREDSSTRMRATLPEVHKIASTTPEGPETLKEPVTLQSIGAALVKFNKEEYSECFDEWLKRLPRGLNLVKIDRLTRGLVPVVNLMLESEKFRAQCFDIARDSTASCRDRVLIGYDLLQDALLLNRVNCGNIWHASLYRYAVMIFNMNCLESKVNEIAVKTGKSHETVELMLYANRYAELRMILPEVSGAIHNSKFVKKLIPDFDKRIESAISDIDKLYSNHGVEGFPAFLAGEGVIKFTAWKDFLRKSNLGKFNAISERNESRRTQQIDELQKKQGHSAQKEELVSEKCQQRWRRETIKLVTDLTWDLKKKATWYEYPVLPDFSGPVRQGLRRMESKFWDCCPHLAFECNKF